MIDSLLGRRPHIGATDPSTQGIGSYRLLSRIGEGGMGEVWRASHQLLTRPAAIKSN
jgi:serine/threonine-protein kinase